MSVKSPSYRPLTCLCVFCLMNLCVAQNGITQMTEPGFSDLETLSGDTTCPYGSASCLPCVADVLAQINDLKTEEDDSGEFNFRNKANGINFSLLKHAQGIARIPGCGSENVFVITRHHTTRTAGNGIISIVFPEVQSGGDGFMGSGIDKSNSGEIVQLFSTNDNRHPGGCQIIGQTLLVTHESGVRDMKDKSWISFYDVSNPADMRETSRLYMDGTDILGQTYPLTPAGQADAVGIAKLEDGRYLLLAMESRRRMKNDVAWFFVSTTNDLNNTEWEFRQFWQQTELIPGRKDWRVYENINLVTNCSDGQIYLLGFHGVGRNNYLDVFSLNLDLKDRIIVKRVLIKAIRTRLGGASFRAGGTVHVTPANDLVLYGIEKAELGFWMMIEEFTR